MPDNRPALAAWLAFLAATLFFLFEFVARISPSLAPDDIAKWYGLGEAGFSTLSSLFFWVYAPMQIAVGLALDRFGARRLVLPAIALCAAGVALFTLTPVPVIGGIGRMLTGLGASFAFVGALYVVNHRFPAGWFAVLSGAVNAIGMLGTAIGAVWLSDVIAGAGWRPVFFTVALCGAGIFALAIFTLKDRATGTPAPGGARQALAALTRDGRVWLIAILGALYYMPVNVYGGLWGKTEIMHDRGLPDASAELAVSMIFWGMAAGSVGAGALSDRLGHRKFILFAGALGSAASYAAALFLPGLSLVPLAVLLFLGGLFGGAQMLTFAMAKEGHPAAISGTIIAFVNMIGIGGALIFQPLVGWMIQHAGGTFFTAMLTMPGCVLAAALLTLPVREMRHPDHAAD